ncbi:hypothetical protein SAMN06265360_108185 [Haloechinothrix alba]|uniref:DUF4190 domain-containing protein n=1 Tax=Haloechinothrix alba TaxID=664784 RepID=A0A238X1B6_9PSEU|nr:DUF4190 domain-containing protein [Haloechinothrix alba]SNR52667.1 hypothetical protein SAMN06265360_108185 [Haloechinothrix alba]
MTQEQDTPSRTREPRNGFGITALVLAFVGLVFGLVPLTGFIGFTLGVLAVLFGFLGWGRARRGVATNKTMSVIGGLLGGCAIALGIWGMSVVFGAFDELGEDLDRISAGVEREAGEL